jgi:Tfp pilus assembly protein PilO
MGTSQKWYLGAGVLAVLILAAGWFLMVSPQNATAEEITLSAESQQAANRITEQEIATLKAEFKDLPVLQKEAAEIRSRMPQTPELPALLRTISANAKSAGVTLVSVSPQTPTALSGSGQAGSAALATPGQVNQIPIVVEVTGPFANMRLFLNSMEQMKRSVLVTSLDLKRAETESTNAATNLLAATIAGRVFMANPGTAPAQTAPTTTTPADGAAAPADPAS